MIVVLRAMLPPASQPFLDGRRRSRGSSRGSRRWRGRGRRHPRSRPRRSLRLGGPPVAHRRPSCRSAPVPSRRMLTGHDGAGPLGRGPRDPGADPPVRRRRADPVGGPRRGARGSHPRRRAREASAARQRPRPVRDEHAEGARRRRVHDAPAGPRLGADRSGDERARLVRPHAAGVGAGRVLARAAGALDRAGGARRAARVLRDHRRARARTSTRSPRPPAATATTTC